MPESSVSESPGGSEGVCRGCGHPRSKGEESLFSSSFLWLLAGIQLLVGCWDKGPRSLLVVAELGVVPTSQPHGHLQKAAHNAASLE